MGMTGETNLAGAFNLLSRELETYLKRDEAGVVYACYAIASACADPELGLTKAFIQQSVSSTLELARLRLAPEFLAANLLYFTASALGVNVEREKEDEAKDKKASRALGSKAEKEDDAKDKKASRVLSFPESARSLKTALSELPPGATFKAVPESLARLLEVGRVFDVFLPWKKRDLGEEVRKKFLEARIKASETNSPDAADEAERQRISATLLKALFSTEVPEIPVVKAVERLCMLEQPEDVLPAENLRRMLAQEAFDIHAEAAEILGVHAVKWRLQDTAFSILSPADYAAIVKDLDERREQRENSIRQAVDLLSMATAGAGIAAEITGRPKHIYGLHVKRVRGGQSIKEINDNLGLRVIVSTKEQCYRALDVLHRLWKPVRGIYENGLIRDWIASPKANGYQSIHTTVTYAQDGGRLLEVQIRTAEMHETAEYGVAAHWVYKRAGNVTEKQSEYYRYVKQMADVRRQLEANQQSRHS